MLAGTNAVTFGMHVPSSTHRDAITDGCVDCHMAPTPGSGVEPAEGQEGRDFIGEHTFTMSWEGIDNVVACERCHNMSSSFADLKARKDVDGDGTVESTADEIHGLLDEVAMLLPPVGEPTVSVTDEFNKIQLKAAYNYLFVEEDKSSGAHNFQYAVGLLKLAKAALEYGVLAAGHYLIFHNRVIWYDRRFVYNQIRQKAISSYARALEYHRVHDGRAGTDDDIS